MLVEESAVVESVFVELELSLADEVELLPVVDESDVEAVADEVPASDSSHEATSVAKLCAGSVPLAEVDEELLPEELVESWLGGGPNMGGGGGLPEAPTAEDPEVEDWSELPVPSVPVAALPPASCNCSRNAIRSELSVSVLDVVWVPSVVLDDESVELELELELDELSVLVVAELEDEACALASQA